MSKLHCTFISAALTGEVADLFKLGVTEDMIDSSVRPVYHFIKTHAIRYGKFPSKGEIHSSYPDFQFYKVREPIKYYAEKVRKETKGAKLRELLGNVADLIKEDKLDDAIKETLELSDGLRRVSQITSGLNYGETLTHFFDWMESEEHTARFTFGDPVLDGDLMGLEIGDWCLIAGTAAAGKSWYLLKLAHGLWRMKERVLFVSLELSKKMICRRLHSLSAKVNYFKFRRNEFTDAEREILRQRIEALDKSDNLIIIDGTDYDYSLGKFGSLESIRAKVQEYKPTVLLVDGIYLGMGMEKWSDAVNYANEFHSLLRELQIPCISTTQLKSVADASKPRLNDLAFTSAFQQATDFVLLLAKSEEMRQRNEAILTVGKAREAMDCHSYIMEFNPGEKLDLLPMTLANNNVLQRVHEEKIAAEKKGGLRRA